MVVPTYASWMCIIKHYYYFGNEDVEESRAKFTAFREPPEDFLTRGVADIRVKDSDVEGFIGGINQAPEFTSNACLVGQQGESVPVNRGVTSLEIDEGTKGRTLMLGVVV